MDILDFFELCSVGDWVTVQNILENRLVDVNYQHKINGWTALHWSSCRGHKRVVELLLKHGAESALVDAQGRSPADVATDHSIICLLGGPDLSTKDNAQTKTHLSELPIVPNYLQNPVFLHSKTAAPALRPPTHRGDQPDRGSDRFMISVSPVVLLSGVCAVGVIALAFLIRRHMSS